MTDMKSIRFPAPAADDMVRAILDNRKTVTRRVVKPQPEITPIPTFGGSYRISMDKNLFVKPLYRTGDVLYVRETWRLVDFDYIDGDWSANVSYKADCGIGPRLRYLPHGSDERCGWRPAIHMPHEAARIFLRVTDVRVERLREITPEQLRAEGFPIFVTPSECENSFNRFGAVCDYKNKLEKFSDLWDSTIKPADRDLYGWEANPWVWVIEFERCGKP